MTWNYRIIRHADGSFALHEVFYDENRIPTGYTDPISFSVEADEGPDALISSLKNAIKDAEEQPVIDISDFGVVDASRNRGHHKKVRRGHS